MTLGIEYDREEDIPPPYVATGETLNLAELKAYCSKRSDAYLSVGVSDGLGFESCLTKYDVFIRDDWRNYGPGVPGVFITMGIDTYVNTDKRVSFKDIELENRFRFRSGLKDCQVILGIPAQFDHLPVYMAFRRDERPPISVHSRRGIHWYGPVKDVGPHVSTNITGGDLSTKKWWVDENTVSIWCSIPEADRVEKRPFGSWSDHDPESQTREPSVPDSGAGPG